MEALHGEKTGEQILGDLCKWMDAYGSLATLRPPERSGCQTLIREDIRACLSFAAERERILWSIPVA